MAHPGISSPELLHYNSAGEVAGPPLPMPAEPLVLAIGSEEDFFVNFIGSQNGIKFKSGVPEFEFAGNFGDVAVDPTSGDFYTSGVEQYGKSGAHLAHFSKSLGDGGAGMAVNASSGTVYAANSTGIVNIYVVGPTITLPDATTSPASDFTPESITMRGVVNPDGQATTDCYFEWGPDLSYGNKVPCSEGSVFSGSADQQVSAPLSGLVKGTVYHYRVVAENANATISGLDRPFSPSAAPTLSNEFVSEVHSDSVILHGDVNPEGAASEYHFEYGIADCASSSCADAGEGKAPLGIGPQGKSIKVTGLQPGTKYSYRIVATNQSGTTDGTEHFFRTFPLTQLLEDRCPNAHVRQQTSAALLLDCRAYELVSAANTGGYDVESSLVPSHDPSAGTLASAAFPRRCMGSMKAPFPGLATPRTAASILT